MKGLAVVAVQVLLPAALGYGSYVHYYPNGEDLEIGGKEYEALGHKSPDDGDELVNFGMDYASTRDSNVWQSECGRCNGRSLCEFDSDGDGLSNGFELGDPCCQWTRANKGAGVEHFRTSDLSDPSRAGSTPSSTAVPTCSAMGPVIPLRGGGTTRRMGWLLPIVVLAVGWAAAAAVVHLAPERLARFRVRPIGPVFHKAAPLWLQAVDFCGVRDLPSAFLGLSAGELVGAVVVGVALILAFALNVAQASDNNTGGKGHLAAGVGYVANFCFALTCLPTQRLSVWSTTMGVPFERGIKYHRWIGRATLLAVLVHFWVEWDSLGYPALDTTSYSDYAGPNAYGTYSLIVLAALVVLAMEPLRRRLFELFYWLHVPLALAALVLACLHAVTLRYLLMFPAALWIIDLGSRLVRGRFQQAKLVEAATVDDGAGGSLIKLVIEQPAAAYEAGGYVFLNVPAAAWFQWHPFSVSAKVSDTTYEIDVRTPAGASSGFCVKLAKAVQKHGKDLTVFAEGMYGRPSLDIAQFDVGVYVAGGIGVTPMLSLLQEAVQSHDSNGAHFVFVWTVRTREMVAHFEHVIQPLADAGVDVRIHLSQRKGAAVSPTQPPVGSAPDLYPEDPEGNQVVELSQVVSSPALDTKPGRADVAAILAEVTAAHKGKRFAAFACGPAPMLAAVQTAGRTCDVLVHTETFEF